MKILTDLESCCGARTEYRVFLIPIPVLKSSQYFLNQWEFSIYHPSIVGTYFLNGTVIFSYFMQFSSILPEEGRS